MHWITIHRQYVQFLKLVEPNLSDSTGLLFREVSSLAGRREILVAPERFLPSVEMTDRA
jgi:hypothetical protein